MEAELRSYADVVAHDLREPITGMAHARDAARAAGRRSRRRRRCCAQLRASTERARD